MIHIRQAIIVEGKYDKIKLSSIVNAMIIVTNGYSIFKDMEKLELIRTLARSTGILILTDSDAAGFRIRGYLKGAIGGDGAAIKNVYIPDIFGKERRKDKPSKEGKLGVEGIPANQLVAALEKAGVLLLEAPEKREPITRMHLYEDGFMGGENSTVKRATLLQRLGLPALLSTSSMLEVMNTMLTLEEYAQITNAINCNNFYDTKEQD